MPENPNSEERARIERAKRLRRQIEKLKTGTPVNPDGPQSIKEQLDERAPRKKPLK